MLSQAIATSKRSEFAEEIDGIFRHRRFVHIFVLRNRSANYFKQDLLVRRRIRLVTRDVRREEYGIWNPVRLKHVQSCCVGSHFSKESTTDRAYDYSGYILVGEQSRIRILWEIPIIWSACYRYFDRKLRKTCWRFISTPKLYEVQVILTP